MTSNADMSDYTYHVLAGVIGLLASPRDLNPTAVKGHKHIPKRCNYKPAVALQCLERKRWKQNGSRGTCIVLVLRTHIGDSARSTQLLSAAFSGLDTAAPTCPFDSAEDARASFQDEVPEKHMRTIVSTCVVCQSLLGRGQSA